MKYRVHWLIGDVESDHHDLEILFSDRNKDKSWNEVELKRDMGSKPVKVLEG